MLLVLSSFLLLTGCSMHSFVRTGYAPVCLVNYQAKTIDCSYATMKVCRDKYQEIKGSICFPGKDLK